MPVSFEYAVIRIVPRVEREEFLNAGVILFSNASRFLQAKVRLDEERLNAFAGKKDWTELEDHLKGFKKVADGADDAGPIARLSQRERFHWLVSPRSTAIQVSAVHAGLCEDPREKLEQLFRQLVS